MHLDLIDTFSKASKCLRQIVAHEGATPPTKASAFERMAGAKHEHGPDEFTCMKRKAGHSTGDRNDRVFEHQGRGVPKNLQR